jgi:hypothetical protein
MKNSCDLMFLKLIRFEDVNLNMLQLLNYSHVVFQEFVVKIGIELFQSFLKLINRPFFFDFHSPIKLF